MGARTPKPSRDLAGIAARIVACEQCPRLRRWCQEVARTRRRAYRDQVYWGRPVPGFGDPRARIWIVGLAPGAHGANRTGRMFTGDSSGDWLYRALHAAGLARIPTSTARDDGQALRGAYLSAAARCAPPDNKPRPVELRRCAPFLDDELRALAHVRVVVALGRVAWDAVCSALERAGWTIPRPRPRFAHRARVVLAGPGAPRPLALLASYHPSRQNTQTGRLTRPMLDAVFADAVAAAGAPESHPPMGENMTKLVVACAAALCAVSAAPAIAHEGHSHAKKEAMVAPVTPIVAVAVLHPASGSKVSGTARFTQTGDKVDVVVEVTGLTPNQQHAIHVHEFGDCTAADAMSAGTHYNPEGHPHALPDAATRHAGDLGNLQADAQGKARLALTVDNCSIEGPKNPILGRSVIVHAKHDDGGQPVGNAGGRIACGVIGVTKAAE